MTHDNSNFLADYSRFLESAGPHLTYAAISIYRNFNDELSEKEKQFLKKHIDSCPVCSARLKEVSEVEGSVSRPGFASIPRISPTVYRYAMAASIVIAVGIVSALYLSNRNHEEQSGRSSPGEGSLALQTLSQEKFVPNEMLENFVDRTMRSGAEFKFLTPGVGDTLATPFTFRWNSQKGGRSYTVRVMDNKNGQVWMGSTGSGSIEFTTRIAPGLYYAKLEADGALVCVGKFIIVRK